MSFGRTAPHPEEATKLLEFLTSDFAQAHFANQNNEYAAVEGASDDDSTQRLGAFKADTTTNTSAFSRNAW